MRDAPHFGQAGGTFTSGRTPNSTCERCFASCQISKAAVRIPVVDVGLITEFERAEAIVATGDADLVALARTALYDPRWP